MFLFRLDKYKEIIDEEPQGPTINLVREKKRKMSPEEILKTPPTRTWPGDAVRDLFLKEHLDKSNSNKKICLRGRNKPVDYCVTHNQISSLVSMALFDVDEDDLKDFLKFYVTQSSASEYNNSINKTPNNAIVNSIRDCIGSHCSMNWWFRDNVDQNRESVEKSLSMIL